MSKQVEQVTPTQRTETEQQKLWRILRDTQKQDARTLVDYQLIISTDKGLKGLIKSGKCPLVINQFGSYHVVFPVSRRNDQVITNTTPYADDDKHVYVSHTPKKTLKGPKTICRYMSVTQEQAATIVRRISKALIDLGRTKEAGEYLIGKKFARPF